MIQRDTKCEQGYTEAKSHPQAVPEPGHATPAASIPLIFVSDLLNFVTHKLSHMFIIIAVAECHHLEKVAKYY